MIWPPMKQIYFLFYCVSESGDGLINFLDIKEFHFNPSMLIDWQVGGPVGELKQNELYVVLPGRPSLTGRCGRSSHQTLFFLSEIISSVYKRQYFCHTGRQTLYHKLCTATPPWTTLTVFWGGYWSFHQLSSVSPRCLVILVMTVNTFGNLKNVVFFLQPDTHV